MSHLNPDKLHVTLQRGVTATNPVRGRHYTLTHSDRTGDLFLTIGPMFDHKAISGWYTRLMRDEVLAEWQNGAEGTELHVDCHVSGGIALGTASWRYNIFQQHMRQVLEAFRYGDDTFFAGHPELDNAPIFVHFHARQPQFNIIERWGVLADYRMLTHA